ncbi:hypothetical protein A6A07_07075 [Streptomyces sp. CB03911]|nr:hypothetical protein A6A07_07075 [Streptomyces sp. CB03911]
MAPPGVDLVTPAEFNHVARTVRDNNPGMADELSRRIVAEALAFLAAVSRNPEAALAPSPVVDEGWHALVLNTPLYARVCEQLGGFIHHVPEFFETTRYDGGVIQRTVTAMAGAGFAADLTLWAGPDEGGVKVTANVWHSPGPNCGPIIVNPPGVPKPGKVPTPA